MSSLKSPDLWARLNAFTAQPVEPPGPRRLGYRRRAALLVWFDQQHVTEGEEADGSGPPDPELLDFLADDCDSVVGPDGKTHWALNDFVRRSALAELATARELKMAMAQLRWQPDDPLQAALAGLLTGAPSSSDAESSAQLRAKLRAVDWLSGLVDGLPDTSELRARLQLAELTDPLRELLSAGFEGRKDALDRLGEYVGARPGGALRRKARAAVRRGRGGNGQLPLLIWGPGGVGKSTLVARFVLDRYENVKSRDRIPFAYLNFDRAVLDPARPWHVIIEVIRQLSLQYPQAADEAGEVIERIAEAAQRVETREKASSGLALDVAAGKTREEAAAGLARVVQRIPRGKQPLLLVFDTFEEVQRRGTPAVRGLGSQLEILRTYLPRLRVVLAGRVRVDHFPTDELRLGDFDDKAAFAYLRARAPGLADRDVREAVRRVGGSPLRLRLAVRILTDRAGDASLAFLRLEQAQVEVVLHDRILDHIADPDVRRIAHPGLFVRRVTPAVIAEVLAENCGLGPVDAERARSLFNHLAEEAALVERRPEDPDALYHRRDVRLMTLGELQCSVPDTVAAIHREAVRFYARKSSSLERAEELYHRMMLGEPAHRLIKRWDEAAGRWLRDSFDELPKTSQVFLATRLAIEIDETLRSEADLENWVRCVKSEAEQLSRVDMPGEALALVRARRGLGGESLLPALETKLLEQRNDLDAALDVARRWLERTIRAGRAGEFVEASLTVARLAQRVKAITSAKAVAQRAQAVLRGSSNRLDRLRVNARMLSIERASGAAAARDDLVRETIALAKSVGVHELVRHPVLLRDLAAEIGAGYPELLTAAIRNLGIDIGGEQASYRLAEALGSWEQALAAERSFAADAPGAMARAQPEASVSDSWRMWLSAQRAGEASRQVALLMEEFGPVTAELSKCLADLFKVEADRELRLGRTAFSDRPTDEWPERATAAHPPPAGPNVSISGEHAATSENLELPHIASGTGAGRPAGTKRREPRGPAGNPRSSHLPAHGNRRSRVRQSRSRPAHSAARARRSPRAMLAVCASVVSVAGIGFAADYGSQYFAASHGIILASPTPAESATATPTASAEAGTYVVTVPQLTNPNDRVAAGQVAEASRPEKLWFVTVNIAARPSRQRFFVRGPVSANPSTGYFRFPDLTPGFLIKQGEPWKFMLIAADTVADKALARIFATDTRQKHTTGLSHLPAVSTTLYYNIINGGS